MASPDDRMITIISYQRLTINVLSSKRTIGAHQMALDLTPNLLSLEGLWKSQFWLILRCLNWSLMMAPLIYLTILRAARLS